MVNGSFQAARFQVSNALVALSETKRAEPASIGLITVITLTDPEDHQDRPPEE